MKINPIEVTPQLSDIEGITRRELKEVWRNDGSPLDFTTWIRHNERIGTIQRIGNKWGTRGLK